MENVNYHEIIKRHQLKPLYFKNTIRAFFVGGVIALIGQAFIELFHQVWGLEKTTAQVLMTVTLIFVASLLTGMGLYDRIGQWSGAGTIVPITGFANSMTSAALEYKSEGIVLGIASNLFKLAGSVITFGVVSAYIIGIIRYLVEMI